MASHPSREPASDGPSEPSRRVAERYEVLKQLARGGMGVVYLVRDEVSGEERALKRVSLRDPRRRDVYRAAFEREYQVLASLDHPRIVRVYEYGVDDEGPYYTMELVRGRDLKKGVPRPWREVCSLMRDVASSMALLHARRLVYRDLNPGNVKVTSEEHCKLLDFGALTDFGPQKWLVGAPPCIPPEALLGDGLDQRADLFALGALTYWTLTGQHAFPALEMGNLPDLWKEPPRRPSELTVDLPEALDALVMSLLSIEPLARPGSAAEVIAKLTTIGKLPAEERDERRRVAQSFLTVPPFVGRARELAMLDAHVREAIAGRGSVVRVRAPAGAGRTRLVEEAALHAQLAGATALRVDASMHAGANGTARALVLRLLDLLPDLAASCAAGHRAALSALGGGIDARLPGSRASVPEPALAGADALWGWFVAVGRQRPLVIAVDNAELCDEASRALLGALVEQLADVPIVLIAVERDDAPGAEGSEALPSGEPLCFGNLVRDELRTLARTLFGETPHVERFADWLHDRSGGSPLYALELVRQLVAREAIRYGSGYWVLPVRRGEADVALPEALEDALAHRLEGLSPGALALAQALALLRTEPSYALCRALVARIGPRVLSEQGIDDDTRARLDELIQQGILVHEQEVYRFGSGALRDVARGITDDFERIAHHADLGEALAGLATTSEMAMRLEAGWHLMEGGHELRGAQLVASVMSGSFRLTDLGLDSYPLGPVSARALRVYVRHRRSAYERVPLLGAIAQAILHDNYALYERHADEVVDALEHLSGMGLARRLSGVLGRWLALVVALLFALVRFSLVPKRERSYSFKELIGQLGNGVCLFTGAAALGLDAERSEQVARTIAPLGALPEVSTLRGVHQLVNAMTLIGRERQAEAYASFGVMMQRFQDPRWYRLLPPSERSMCLATAHYSRAGISVFRADGSALLEDAAALETSGLRAYALVVPHLRYLYHAARGELPLAAPYQAQIEELAVQGGVAWHAELWVSAALVPVHLACGDLMGVTHTVHRLEELTRIAPSMHFYHRLGKLALMLAREDIRESNITVTMRELDSRPPRSFIGWTALVAATAGVRNRQGRHEEARALCERALSVMTDADREYVGLFLPVDLETATADAGLGRSDLAFKRLDGLLARFAPTGHPLALGLLHETRARIALRVGLPRTYQESFQAMESIFRGTGTPALIAKIDRLATLARPADKSRARPSQEMRDEEPLSTVMTGATEVVSNKTRATRRREV